MGERTGEERPGLSTHHKALKVNLDPLRYGTLVLSCGSGRRHDFEIGFGLRHDRQRCYLRAL
ncbi:MAG TPA: hypothetical protein VNH18_14290 [Bryobacteraceae bacterium]|nr:hypothetical protein [Bryobacteraceae bacterium]